MRFSKEKCCLGGSHTVTLGNAKGPERGYEGWLLTAERQSKEQRPGMATSQPAQVKAQKYASRPPQGTYQLIPGDLSSLLLYYPAKEIQRGEIWLLNHSYSLH
jgi:hypothetical protein